MRIPPKPLMRKYSIHKSATGAPIPNCRSYSSLNERCASDAQAGKSFQQARRYIRVYHAILGYIIVYYSIFWLGLGYRGVPVIEHICDTRGYFGMCGSRLLLRNLAVTPSADRA